MLTLIIGGSGSGKSAFAEEKVLSYGQKKRFYIATMEIFDEESKKRVEKHRRMRADKQFETIECPVHLEDVRVPEGSIVLLECMSNLVANEMFSPKGRKSDTAEIILNGVRQVNEMAEHMVIVTNSVFSDGCEYDEGTMDYLACLGKVNGGIVRLADHVFEVVCGIPISAAGHVKGDFPSRICTGSASPGTDRS